MTDLVRLTTRWDGWPGSPGYTNLYAQAGADAQATADAFEADIRAFWLTINGFLSNQCTLTVGPVYQVLDDESGQIVGEGNVTTPGAAITGNSASAFAGNSGAAVNWSTDAFINGRRLKGRTYLVPLVGIFDGFGTLSTTAISALDGAAEVLLAATPTMVVWHRPVGGAGGSSALIVSSSVRDRAAVLRSRSI